MAKRNVVDFKIINLSEEKFQELKEAGQIDPNALYTTPDTTKERLDALEGTVVNYDNITNCITEIPQDIKLELNNGTLTLKAGSKVYVPNGAGAFDEVVKDLDLVYNFGTPSDGQYLVFNSQYFYKLSNCVSGATDSKAGQGYHSWYDTTNNLVKQYWADGSTPARTDSLPVAIITISGGTITSIDQVFNGFGYIGSTVFVLPGVKGIIPNGRNEDGTLKNITVNNASVKTVSGWIANSETIQITTDGTVYASGSLYYDPKQNICLNHRGEQTLRLNAGAVIFGTSGKITFFESKTAFHAVDYNDTQFIARQAMPSNKADFLTIGSSGATYTAPADGYFIIRATANTAGGYAVISNENIQLTTNPVAINEGGGVQSFLPVKTGDVVYVWYKDITVNHFRFIYAEGAK